MMKAPKNPSTQPRLFQVIDMEELVPPHHILRQINKAVDFPSFTIGWLPCTRKKRVARRRIRNGCFA